jgi:hypothetical protein
VEVADQETNKRSHMTAAYNPIEVTTDSVLKPALRYLAQSIRMPLYTTLYHAFFLENRASNLYPGLVPAIHVVWLCYIPSPLLPILSIEVTMDSVLKPALRYLAQSIRIALYTTLCYAFFLENRASNHIPGSCLPFMLFGRVILSPPDRICRVRLPLLNFGVFPC